MSMNASFVAITPAQLAAIKDRPETVGNVFALDAALPAEIPSLAQERLRRQAPQLVNDMLNRLPPEVQQDLRRRLGLGADGRAGAGARNPVLLQLAQREAARRRQPPAPGNPGHGVSLDKAWHGVHYLLCGAAEPRPGPFGQAVFGGAEIGEDLGYGPPRYFPPAEVAEIADALRSPGLSATLRARFDAAAMARLGIYPGTWEADDRTWLVEAFRKLRDFYAAAGKAGQAVVTRIE